MLLELQVNNLALITEAKIELGDGLTVLTGETGAGKTALLSALKLLVGERGDTNYVRDGANEATAQALFLDAEHVVVRRLSADGRSRCYLDDTMVTVKTLASTIGPLVDLYGQHEHQSLLKPAQQLAALDNFGGEPLLTALANYQQAYRAHHQAALELESLQATANSSSAAKEQAAFVLREINKVDPQPDEYEQLKLQLPVLQNGEELARATNRAVELLRDDQQIIDKLALAAAELEALRQIDPQLDKLTNQLNEILISAEDLALELRSYRDSVEFDAQALEATLERLSQLDGIIKRFGPTLADVFAAKQSSEQLVVGSSDFEERLSQAKANLKQHQELRTQAAEQLASQRQANATLFSQQLAAAVHSLAMAGANFEFAVAQLPEQNWTLSGSQTYELLYCPEPNTKPRPLARIASGGELSRVMLALKTMLHSSEQQMTLVFDEIDAGIGGATATAVAERLQQLAQVHQVIVVTHLAQIAAKAQTHFVVSKQSSKQGASTVINQVTGEQRTQEIARMLSGSTDKTALEHANQLLEWLV
jgi:DNA repair protein RecN (Recombination protein N)